VSAPRRSMPAGGRLRVVDLFAGCGGLTQGFVMAQGPRRFEPVAAVELDRHAAATYAANHGHHVYVGDIREWLKGDLPEADLVVGGPPCQGFSALGTQDPADPRNSLWEAFVDTVARIHPTVFVIENVPQFLGSVQFERLQRETRRGRLAGYEIEPSVLNSADYGAPQLRRRAVVIGRLRGTSAFGEPEKTTPERNLTVAHAFAGVPASVTATEPPDRHEVVDGVSMPGPFSSTDLHITRNFRPLSLERFQFIPAGGNRHDLPRRLQAPCWIRHHTGAGDVMGRLRWGSPSVTIRTEFFKPEKGRYLHPEEDRAITHLEAARLQGFPDDYRWFGSKSSIARQIGNAVPIELGRSVAEYILNRWPVEGDVAAA